jgi:hypothetical protein
LKPRARNGQIWLREYGGVIWAENNPAEIFQRDQWQWAEGISALHRKEGPMRMTTPAPVLHDSTRKN